MSDNPADRSGSWLREPPGSNDFSIQVVVGEGTELPPGFLESLDKLVGGMMEGEVAGFKLTVPGCSTLSCPELADCGGFYCNGLSRCGKLSSAPCLANVVCAIKSY